MLADRVAVIYEGRISESVAAADAEIAELGLLMTGAAVRCRAAAGPVRPMSAPATPRRHLLPFAHPRPSAAWRRLEASGVVTTIGAVAVALLISAVLIWLIGGDPVGAYAHIVRASLGSVGVLSDTLVKATPLIFTGLACSVAFRMRLWNIGAEGQLMMGAWGASAVVLLGWLPEGTSGLDLHPADDGRRHGLGALWAGHRRLAQGAAQRQRDHHHPDARVHRPEVAAVLVVRALERGRLPDVGPLPARGLAAASDRLQPRRARLRGPDRAPRLRVRGHRRGRGCGSSSTARARATRSGSSATTPGRPGTPASTSAAPSSW